MNKLMITAILSAISLGVSAKSLTLNYTNISFGSLSICNVLGDCSTLVNNSGEVSIPSPDWLNEVCVYAGGYNVALIYLINDPTEDVLINIQEDDQNNLYYDMESLNRNVIYNSQQSGSCPIIGVNYNH